MHSNYRSNNFDPFLSYSNMIFRNATIADLSEINTIENLCFPSNEAASSETLEKRLRVFPQHFWLLEKDGQVLGFINGMVTDHETIIDEMFKNVDLHNEKGKWQSVFGLAVSPDHRNNGYAAQLINHLVSKSKEQNRIGVTLTCKNYLVDYYKKLGFLDQGISASVHGGEIWHDMTLRF